MQMLDHIDFMLLDELQQDGKQSIKKLAEKVGLSITPVHERIKKMETSGVIENYVAVVNPKQLGKKLVAYCQVKLLRHQGELFEEFERYISTLDEVLEASYMAGGYDFLLKLVLNDMEEYQRFVVHKISKLEIIANIQSSFVIKEIKNTSMIKCLRDEAEFEYNNTLKNNNEI
ncbi:Lrp/AsnC family transcriptional regulator [Capnocytophaga cynodegmi]|uniref:Leucine-responsive regulatory protein n=1 Tax=Capnocytophaga cynodegmi TaxID=28189 RepID=A0A0B7HRI0_9FLAO|nr:Lrp/AsnC family transcriptional regulator [Capnocytophaga cynodegmi]GJQ06154.1 AsnC family transcriptional regulator [Capnocytophaga cynodegmi]CEN37051.1 Leucine-responsive regulatory protein [Capnocytophaga cynodegmi]CEN40178.1 Leucine-responsive regulatory protein [Capnocytophaga cynodegmi]